MRDQVQIASFIRTFSVTIAHCSKAFEAVVVIKQQAALQARGSRGGGGARRCTSTRRQREHAIARVHQCQPHQREPHPTRPRLTAFKDHRRIACSVDVQRQGHLHAPSAAGVCDRGTQQRARAPRHGDEVQRLLDLTTVSCHFVVESCGLEALLDLPQLARQSTCCPRGWTTSLHIRHPRGCQHNFRHYAHHVERVLYQYISRTLLNFKEDRCL